MRKKDKLTKIFFVVVIVVVVVVVVVVSKYCGSTTDATGLSSPIVSLFIMSSFQPEYTIFC